MEIFVKGEPPSRSVGSEERRGRLLGPSLGTSQATVQHTQATVQQSQGVAAHASPAAAVAPPSPGDEEPRARVPLGTPPWMRGVGSATAPAGAPGGAPGSWPGAPAQGAIAGNDGVGASAVPDANNAGASTAAATVHLGYILTSPSLMNRGDRPWEWLPPLHPANMAPAAALAPAPVPAPAVAVATQTSAARALFTETGAAGGGGAGLVARGSEGGATEAGGGSGPATGGVAGAKPDAKRVVGEARVGLGETPVDRGEAVVRGGVGSSPARDRALSDGQGWAEGRSKQSGGRGVDGALQGAGAGAGCPASAAGVRGEEVWMGATVGRPSMVSAMSMRSNLSEAFWNDSEGRRTISEVGGGEGAAVGGSRREQWRGAGDTVAMGSARSGGVSPEPAGPRSAPIIASGTAAATEAGSATAPVTATAAATATATGTAAGERREGSVSRGEVSFDIPGDASGVGSEVAGAGSEVAGVGEEGGASAGLEGSRRVRRWELDSRDFGEEFGTGMGSEGWGESGAGEERWGEPPQRGVGDEGGGGGQVGRRDERGEEEWDDGSLGSGGGAGTAEGVEVGGERADGREGVSARGGEGGEEGGAGTDDAPWRDEPALLSFLARAIKATLWDIESHEKQSARGAEAGLGLEEVLRGLGLDSMAGAVGGTGGGEGSGDGEREGEGWGEDAGDEAVRRWAVGEWRWAERCGGGWQGRGGAVQVHHPSALLGTACNTDTTSWRM